MNKPKLRRPPVKLILSWPPSVDESYLPARRGKFIKTKIAKIYCREIYWEIKRLRIPTFGKARLKVLIRCYGANSYAYDIANLEKILIDSIQFSGLFKNDSQIDDIRLKRMQVRPPGSVQVIISEL